MLRHNIIIAVILSHCLCCLQGFEGFLCKILCVHAKIKLLSSEVDAAAGDIGIISGFNIMRIIAPGKISFHKPVKKTNVLCKSRGKFIAGAGSVREKNAADKFTVIESIGSICVEERGEVNIFSRV